MFRVSPIDVNDANRGEHASAARCTFLLVLNSHTSHSQRSARLSLAHAREEPVTRDRSVADRGRVVAGPSEAPTARRRFSFMGTRSAAFSVGSNLGAHLASRER